MTEIGAVFTKKLDTGKDGVGGSMMKLMNLIKSQDPALHTRLVQIARSILIG